MAAWLAAGVRSFVEQPSTGHLVVAAGERWLR
jgi:hypothetical protein